MNQCTPITDVILPIFAILISLISLLYARKTIQIQRTHNIKSVTPIGQIVVGDYEDHIYIKLTNNGTGPLIIKSFQVSVFGNFVGNSLIGAIDEQLQSNITWADFVDNVENRALLPGKELILIEAILDVKATKTNILTTEEVAWSELRTFLGEMELQIEYSDIYDSPRILVSRKLDWFARHFKNSLDELI